MRAHAHRNDGLAGVRDSADAGVHAALQRCGRAVYTDARSMIELQNRMATASQRYSDLEAHACDMLPRASYPAAGSGYLEIIEGPLRDLSHRGRFNHTRRRTNFSSRRRRRRVDVHCPQQGWAVYRKVQRSNGTIGNRRSRLVHAPDNESR